MPHPRNRFHCAPLKTTFYVFQRAQDRLYLTPPAVDEQTSSTLAYLGALGFTKPLEQIVLRTAPLKSLLKWLVKPRGPHLVEATMGGAPEKALVLAVTKRMLYQEDPPYVGVGLVYKPLYISTESFCHAYMHLDVWHAAASSEDSTDKLDHPRFILVSISETSEVMPDALLHPLLRHEPERFPLNMRQGPKMRILLGSPSSRHWNIDSDLSFTIAVETYRQRHEAKKIGQDPQQETTETAESPQQTPPPQGASPAIASSSQAASPRETASKEECDLELVRDAARHLLVVRLQAMHNMGCVREVEQAAIRTLLAEFARVQAILGEDLTRSLSVLHSELEALSEALSADVLDVLNLCPGDPGFSGVKELLLKHHQTVSLKVNLPLIELEAAKVDLNRFLQECLHELGSGPQAQEVLGEITRRLLGYNRRVTEIVQDTPGLEQPGVCNQLLLTMAVEQPIEAVLLPGILDGLSARLGMPAPGMANPPTSAREGVSR